MSFDFYDDAKLDPRLTDNDFTNQDWPKDFSIEDEFTNDFLEIRMVHTPRFNVVYCELHNDEITVTPSMLKDIKPPKIQRTDLLTVLSGGLPPLLSSFLSVYYARVRGLAVYTPELGAVMVKAHLDGHLRVGDTITFKGESEEIANAMVFGAQFFYG